MSASLPILAALLAAGNLPDGDPGEAPPLVMRIHSLAGLVEPCGREGGSLALLPYRVGVGLAESLEEWEPGPRLLHPEDVCTLVREVVAPFLWDELPDARNDLLREDRLIVIAPDAVQEQVADFLGFLVGALATTERLEVRVFTADEADVARDALALDAVEADRRIAERGLQRSATVALRDRGVVAHDGTEQRTIVYDYDVEIAQGACIADPIVDRVKTGLELIARSSRVEGGLLVDLVVRCAEEAAPAVERRLQARSYWNMKPGVSERLATGAFQHPQVAFASFAGTLFLPAGKAIWIPVTLATHAGPVSVCLDLRAAGPIGPPRGTWEPAAVPERERLRLDLFSRGAAGLRGVEIDREWARFIGAPWEGKPDSPLLARIHGLEDDSPLLEVVHAVAAEPLDGGHGWTGDAGGAVRTLLPPEFSERVAAALAPLQRIDAGFLVRGRLLVDGRSRASFRLPVAPRRPAALWSGVQGTRIADWEVDVANESQCCNPEPQAWIDGLALRLELSRNARGEIVLDVSGSAAVLDGPPRPVELQDDSRLTIDELRARTLRLEELRTLPAQGGKATFGGNVALELEVAPAGR